MQKKIIEAKKEEPNEDRANINKIMIQNKDVKDNNIQYNIGNVNTENIKIKEKENDNMKDEKFGEKLNFDSKDILKEETNIKNVKEEGKSEKSIIEDKKDKNILLDESKANNLSNKYLELIYYKERDYSQIIQKLYSLYCYFNNVSDIYSIINEMFGQFDIKRNNQNCNQYKATLNILIIGRPGGGKSTLINLLLNEKKAREGIGLSITKLYSKYIHNEYPITFIDTPGFENDNDLNKMIDYINQTKLFFGDVKNKIHLILYIINSSNERCFIGEEIKLIKYINKNTKIPIFFICTRAQNIIMLLILRK